ncbi:DUF2628 domain-containing protein [Microbaculum marinisediminis]|uniref:DUF2628 domain-containing protein n=1 Tax=Microbaculum marinisediminis TaxID=2931392 RepID=A0AAW5QZ62_9HYPH|nr:DUF2628 domain-containing protein [Microbaculum sp. A6E488]MCT8972194.1 DUF2628 domain-containing protein [Microbaculum sp. A6E488]
MKVYTVHEPPEGDGDSADRILFVKEGFCWPALFVPMLWLLWHRMWWVLLGWLAISTGLAVLGELVEEVAFIVGVASLLFSFWFALEANVLRRWSLGRKGWRMLGIAAGRDREEAEQSFFRRYLALKVARAPSRSAAPHLPPVPRPAASTTDRPVIGLFPQPE